MAYTFRHGDRPLAGYTIQRGVGRGGFGEVYYALSDAGREVALKYLRDNPEVELRGVSACMNLNSPHLIQIFDVKQGQEGDYFVVMEYMSGPSVRDLLNAEPKGLGPEKAAYLIREIARGLTFLHDRGIVHRDLKPGNLFYEDGCVKIGDYGLSKYISASRHSAQTSSVGTVHYMAPEVGSGNYSRGIDIYALGVMLYEMLMGKVPFEGGSMGEVLMKHLTAQPELDDLPAPFAEVIRKALAKDPADRYQSVDEMAEALLGADATRDALAGFNMDSLSMVAQRAVAGRPASPPPVPSSVRARTDPPRQQQAAAHTPETAVPMGIPVDPSARVYAAAFGRAAPAAWAPPAGVDPQALAPEATAGPLYFAGFWIRVLAALIDMVVVGTVAGLLMLPFGANSGARALYLLLGVLYQGFLVGRWNGQTLGKKALGIKVISDDGQPCGERQAFARALADLLNMFTLGFSYLVVAASSRKRGIHDYVANTLHVYALNETNGRPGLCGRSC
ncbi:MAG: protein kinase [bacterium]|nr:protein kinase [bacterium]